MLVNNFIDLLFILTVGFIASLFLLIKQITDLVLLSFRCDTEANHYTMLAHLFIVFVTLIRVILYNGRGLEFILKVLLRVILVQLLTKSAIQIGIDVHFSSGLATRVTSIGLALVDIINK